MTTVMLALLVSLAWLVGCTDVSSTGPEAPVINSEFRFLNAAEDLGNVSISFILSDAPDVGGLGVGDSNTHQTYPSGNRTGVLSTGDTLRIPMTGEQRATVVLLPDTEGFRDFVKLIERRIFDPSDTAPEALARFAHASPDAGDATVTLVGADTTITWTVSYRNQSGYATIPAGTYAMTIATASGDTLEASTELTNMRQTAVLLGSSSAGTLQTVNLDDN